MIASIILIVGALLALLFQNWNTLIVTMLVASVIINLKQNFHGYEIQKLKEKLNGQSKYEF